MKKSDFAASKKKKVIQEVQDVQAIQEALYQTNKIRLFDILTRVATLGADSVYVAWRFNPAMLYRGKLEKLPGLFLEMPVESGETADHYLRVDSEDHEFGSVEMLLDGLEARHREALEKQRKRDEVLRNMTTEERELVGYKNWKDPDPEGAATLLASRVVKTK